MAVVKILPVTESDHLHHLIDYVQQDVKTMEKELVTCSGCQKETVYKDFSLVKKMFGKTGGVLAHQIIHSFKVDEINVEQAHDISKELAEQMLPGYQYIIATHLDREHIHSHIVFNSVSSITGQKYAGNLSSLSLMRNASDKLCKRYGLSIIEEQSGFRALDKKTYELAKQGKSWKVKLTNDIDHALITKDKKLFLLELEAKGYKVEWKNKHIIFTAPGQTKCIRADTLAKQFGAEYTKINIEKTLGVQVEHLEQEQEQFTRNVVADEHNSEWKKIENFYFLNDTENQLKARNYTLPSFLSSSKSKALYVLRRLILKRYFANKNTKVYKSNNVTHSKVVEVKKNKDLFCRNFGNISYRRLVSVFGENTTVKITPEQMNKLDNIGIFYSGMIKENGDILITFKTINKDIIKETLNINIDLRKTKGEIAEERYRHKMIKQQSQEQNKSLCRFTLTANDLRKLEDNKIPFSYYRKGTEYTTLFFRDDLKQICDIINKDYQTESKTFDEIQNKKNYVELKHSSQLNESKIVYRVIDSNGLNILKDSNLKFAYFEKEDKFNVAFLETDIDNYKKLLQQQEQEKSKKRIR
ncbi:MAG: relaxase/mobilization nuclease domain-containing protein [Oscillospiraceae bacterium]